LITASAQLITNEQLSPLSSTADAIVQIECAFNALRLNWNPATIKALLHAFTPPPSIKPVEPSSPPLSSSTAAAAAASAAPTMVDSVSQSTLLPGSTNELRTSSSSISMSTLGIGSGATASSSFVGMTPIRPSNSHNGTSMTNSLTINPRASTPAISRLLAMSSKAVRSAAPSLIPLPSPLHLSSTPTHHQHPRSAIDFVRRILAKIGVTDAVSSSSVEGTPSVIRKLDITSPSVGSPISSSPPRTVHQTLPNLRVTTKLGLLAASLNREDIGISLAQVEIADIQISATISHDGVAVKGHLGMFTIFDARTATLAPAPSPSNISLSSLEDELMEHTAPSGAPVWLYRQQLFWTRCESGKPLLFISFTDRKSSSSNDVEASPLPVPSVVDEPTSGHDSRLEVRLSSIQCVVVPSWLADLYDYLRNGVLTDAAKEASAQAKAAIVQLQQEPSYAVRSFSITIDHPLLVLPHNFPSWNIDPSYQPQGGLTGMSKARVGYFDWVTVDLGRISVENEFYATSSPHDIALVSGWNGRSSSSISHVYSVVPMQRIVLRMSALNIETIHTLSSPSWVIRPRPIVSSSTLIPPVGEKIFADTDIECIIETPLGSMKVHDIPEAKVDIDVKTVRLIVSVDELAFLMIIYRTDIGPLLLRYATPSSSKGVSMRSSTVPPVPLPSVSAGETKRFGPTSRTSSTGTLTEPLWSPLPPETPRSPLSWRITPALLSSRDDDNQDKTSTSGPWLARLSLRLHKLVLGLNMTRNVTSASSPYSSSSTSRFAELIVGPLAVNIDVRPDHTFTSLLKMDSISLLDARHEVKEPALRRIIAGHKETASDTDDTLSQSDEDTDDTDHDNINNPSASTLLSSSSFIRPSTSSIRTSNSDGKRSSLPTVPLHPHTTPMRPTTTRPRAPFQTTPTTTTPTTSTPNTSMMPPAPTLLPDLRIEVTSENMTAVPMDGVTASSPSSSPSQPHIQCDISFSNPRLLLTSGFLCTMIRFAERFAQLAPAPAKSPSVSSLIPSSNPSWPWNGGRSAGVSVSLGDAQIWIAGDAEPIGGSSTPMSSSRSIILSPASSTRTLASSRSGILASAASLVQSMGSSASSFSCLVLRLDLTASANANVDGTIGGDLRLDQTQAFVCYRATHLRLSQLSPPPSPLMEPWNVTLTYTAYPPTMTMLSVGDDRVAHHVIAMHASPLDSCFSFMQIATAAEIVQSMATTVMEVLPTTSHAPGGAASIPLPSITPPIIVVSSIPSFELTGELDGGHLSIVNDAPGYYLPLLSFTVAPWKFRLGTPSRTPWLTLPDCERGRLATDWFFTQLNIEARYYNEIISRWEPLVEKWMFSLAADLTSLRIWSRDVLDVNITESCVHTLSHGIQSFIEQFLTTSTPLPSSTVTSPSTTPTRTSSSRPSATGKAKGSFFRIRNETGARIRFWLVGPDLSSASLSDANPLVPLSSGDSNKSEGMSHATSGDEKIAVEGIAHKRHHRSIELDAGEETALNLPQYQTSGDGPAVTSGNGNGQLRHVEYRSPVIGTRLFITPKMLVGVDDRNLTPGWRTLRSIPKIDIGALDRATATSTNQIDNDTSAAALIPVSVFPLQRLSSDEEKKDEGDLKYHHHEQATHMVTTDHHLSCRVLPLSEGAGGGKVVVLSSSTSIWNRTGVALQVRLRHTTGDTHATFYRASVAPGARLSLPVLLVSSTHVSIGVRPMGHSVGGITWKWSSYNSTDGLRLASITSNTINNDDTLLHCVPQLENAPSPSYMMMKDGVESDTAPAFAPPRRQPSFTVRVTTIKSQSLTVGRSLQRHHHMSSFYTLVIDAPLILRNSLIVPIEYQVRIKQRPSRLLDTNCQLTDMVTSGVYTGRLQYQREVHWHDVDVRPGQGTLMLLQLRFPHPMTNDDALHMWESEWSDPSVLCSTLPHIPYHQHLEIDDLIGTQLPIYLYRNHELSSPSPPLSSNGNGNGSGIGRIDISVHCLIMNRTGLPMLFATRPGARVEHIAAGQSVDQCQNAMAQWIIGNSNDVHHYERHNRFTNCGNACVLMSR
jgi:hypothetical protein